MHLPLEHHCANKQYIAHILTRAAERKFRIYPQSCQSNFVSADYHARLLFDSRDDAWLILVGDALDGRVLCCEIRAAHPRDPPGLGVRSCASRPPAPGGLTGN
jgi:hypothetical protein